MAIFHLHVKNISRGDGRSAVAAAAYRAGATLPNDAEERDSAFGGRRDVVFTEIRLPDGAPSWMGDRARLWNTAEAAENRKDARLAKEIEFSLPVELDQAAWQSLVRAMADKYVARGHVVDVAIHEDGRGLNPHAHLMLTTRTITAQGFGLKIREADGKTFVNESRRQWETLANAALGKAGLSGKIDARSHAARGMLQEPGRHRGPDPEARRQNREAAAVARDRYDEQEPDPTTGMPVSREAFEQAQEAMLQDMHRDDEMPDIVELGSGDDGAAVAAVASINHAEMSDQDANAYRIAPPEPLHVMDWLDSREPAPPEREPVPQADRDIMNWLTERDVAEPDERDAERERHR